MSNKNQKSPGQICQEGFYASHPEEGKMPWPPKAEHTAQYWEDAAQAVIAAEMAKLQNPSAVHANMLRGSIAKINIRLWAHAHGIHGETVDRLVALLEEHLDAEKEARSA